MQRGGPEPSGFLSIRSCSLVFFSSSDKLLLDRICLLFTASSFTSFRNFALWEEEEGEREEEEEKMEEEEEKREEEEEKREAEEEEEKK